MMRSRASIDTLDRIVVSIHAYHISCILHIQLIVLTYSITNAYQAIKKLKPYAYVEDLNSKHRIVQHPVHASA
jgi:hypothetical protein